MVSSVTTWISLLLLNKPSFLFGETLEHFRLYLKLVTQYCSLGKNLGRLSFVRIFEGRYSCSPSPHISWSLTNRNEVTRHQKNEDSNISFIDGTLLRKWTCLWADKSLHGQLLVLISPCQWHSLFPPLGVMCVRIWPSGVNSLLPWDLGMGLRSSSLSGKLYPAEPSCWICPIFKGTRSVGTLMPALHSCVEGILTAIFRTCLLIWEQEGRPISSVSVSQCMNELC